VGRADSLGCLWSLDLFRCESAVLRTHWVLVVMDQFTRRIVGFAVQRGVGDGVGLCRMFNRATRGYTPPTYVSSDHDPSGLFVVKIIARFIVDVAGTENGLEPARYQESCEVRSGQFRKSIQHRPSRAFRFRRLKQCFEKPPTGDERIAPRQPGQQADPHRSDPWKVIRVEDRDSYLSARDRVSIDMNIAPYTAFVAERVRWSIENGPAAR
jgi:hypothetical protein